MGPFATKFLIDGIDRLGKSSLINRILEDLGYHLVIHYDKPKALKNLLSTADLILDPNSESDYSDVSHLSRENLAKYLYQEDANHVMFELIQSNVPLIFDRTHLGEIVYSPMYRDYDGSYVYKMEEEMIAKKPYTIEDDVRLILLTTSNFDIVTDDGLSFDFSKREEEQNKFIEAFNRSKIPNKVIVDVHNGRGGYRPYEEIYFEAIYKSCKK